MGADPRLKGQELSLRVLRDGVLQDQIDSIGSMTDTVALEIKEDGFLGEPTNRFDSVLNGYGGDMEFQVHDATWVQFSLAVEAKARREIGDVFSVVRADQFANGSSLLFTYPDVSFGEFSTSAGSRPDFIKVKCPWKCSTRNVQVNPL